MKYQSGVVIAWSLWVAVAGVVSADNQGGIKVNIGGDVGIKRSLSYFSDALKGLTFVSTTQADTTFTTTWFNIASTPCPRVTVKRVTGAVNGTVQNGDFDANSTTTSVVFPYGFLYSENGTQAGAQPYEFKAPLALCGISWSDFTVQGPFNDSTTGNNYYLISKCTPITALGINVGTLCFNFSLGNGTYTRSGQVFRGNDIKIDKTFTLSTAAQTALAALPTKYRFGVLANVLTTSDVQSNGTLATTTTSNSGNSASFTADLAITFKGTTTTTAPVAYVNWIKTINCTLTNGTVVSANVVAQQIQQTDFLTAISASGSFSFGGTNIVGSVFGQASASRQTLTFSFEQDLNSVSNFVWDPQVGYATTTTNAAFSVSASLLAVVSLALAVLFMNERL